MWPTQFYCRIIVLLHSARGAALSYFVRCVWNILHIASVIAKECSQHDACPVQDENSRSSRKIWHRLAFSPNVTSAVDDLPSSLRWITVKFSLTWTNASWMHGLVFQKIRWISYSIIILWQYSGKMPWGHVLKSPSKGSLSFLKLQKRTFKMRVYSLDWHCGNNIHIF